MDYKKYLNEYMDFIKYDRDLSENTCHVREQWLERFFNELGEKEFSFLEIREIVRDYKKKDLSSNYVNVLVTTLNSFIRFLIAEKHLPVEDFTSNLNALRPKKQIVLYETLSIEEIEKLINPPARQNNWQVFGKPQLYPRYKKCDEMWSLFLEFLAKTGCRPGEVISLNIGDFNFGNNEFIIRKTKINEQRIVPIPPDMIEKIKKWVKDRGDIPPASPMFITMHFARTRPNSRIGESMINKAIRERAKRAGMHIDQRFHAHAFRHSFVTELLRQDVAISKVQRIVGHRKVDTTMIYTHMITDDLRQAMLKHPLIRKSHDPRAIIESVKEEIKSFKLHTDDRFEYTFKETNDGFSFELNLKKGTMLLFAFLAFNSIFQIFNSFTLS